MSSLISEIFEATLKEKGLIFFLTELGQLVKPDFCLKNKIYDL